MYAYAQLFCQLQELWSSACQTCRTLHRHGSKAPRYDAQGTNLCDCPGKPIQDEADTTLWPLHSFTDEPNNNLIRDQGA